MTADAASILVSLLTGSPKAVGGPSGLQQLSFPWRVAGCFPDGPRVTLAGYALSDVNGDLYPGGDTRPASWSCDEDELLRSARLLSVRAQGSGDPRSSQSLQGCPTQDLD